MPAYDVAFSLLSQDIRVAQEIQSYLPVDIASFIYTEKQQELILARDGLNAVPAVFRDAKICVILFREGWGESRWTRLEQQTVGDRFMDEGSGFLVLVRLDNTGVPPWLPRTDLWVNYVVDGPERVAGYIAERLKGGDPEFPLTRVTRRTLDRAPVPIGRYQTQFQKFTVQYTPVRAEICDGCTAAVEFRPILQVTLPAKDHLPATEEKLCPRCARERGMGITLPKDMDEETLYAYKNPSYADYVRRILKFPVLPSLSADSELQECGVANVGAVVSRQYVGLIVSGPWEPSIEVPLPLYEMERDGVRLESEVIEYCR
jgi:hypothetical protein